MNILRKNEGGYGGREDEAGSYAIDEEAQPLQRESIEPDDFGTGTT
jgi:hypothetical protein